jgi:hypothetical protein
MSAAEGKPMDEEATRRLAQRVLDELDTLVEPDQAAAISGQLADLVDRGGRGEQVAVPIIRLIRAHPALRRAATAYESTNDPTRAVTPPPGDLRLPLAPRYVCPVDGYEFFRHDLARPVPLCPNDGSALVQDPGDAR